MILTDRYYFEHGPELVDPWDPELVNPASLDLRIGGAARGQSQTLVRDYNGELTCDKLYVDTEFTPGALVPAWRSVLVPTLETVRIPDDCAGIIRLKSSRAREGWQLAGAEFLDPGFVGVLSLAVSNGVRGGGVLPHGQKFCQLILFRTEGSPLKTYEGKYQNATTVEGSK